MQAEPLNVLSAGLHDGTRRRGVRKYGVVDMDAQQDEHSLADVPNYAMHTNGFRLGNL